jgi:MYXO-CTERM domain-containing protein
MTYTVSAVRRGFHGAAMPLDLIPARSSTLTDLAIVAGFAVVALAGAVAVCRRRA